MEVEGLLFLCLPAPIWSGGGLYELLDCEDCWEAANFVLGLKLANLELRMDMDLEP